MDKREQQDPVIEGAVTEAFVRIENREMIRKQLEELGSRLVHESRHNPVFQKQLMSDVDSAVNQLVGEVVDRDVLSDEEIRPITNRMIQDAESYILPGLRVQEVSNLVLGTIANIDSAYKRNLQLSTWLFFTSIAIVLVSFVAALMTSDKSLLISLFGGGGILGLIVATLARPINQITSGAGSLVRLNMIYTSFYSQLTMFGKMLNRVDNVGEAKEITQHFTMVTRELIAELNVIEKSSGEQDTTEKGK